LAAFELSTTSRATTCGPCSRGSRRPPRIDSGGARCRDLAIASDDAPLTEDPALANAIRRQEERLARDPTSLVFAQLAELYRRAGRVADAIACCREGLSRHPRDTEGRLILARALADEGQFDAAIAQTRAILALSPKDVQGHRVMAEIARRQGDIDTAVHHLEEVVVLDAHDRASRALLGLLRADPGVRSEGSGLVRVLSDDTFVTIAFGALCLDQGLAEEAAHIFTRLLRRDPHHVEAREGLERALRARFRRKG
jgi:predicted Zn-dependent protease